MVNDRPLNNADPKATQDRANRLHKALREYIAGLGYKVRPGIVTLAPGTQLIKGVCPGELCDQLEETAADG